MRGCGRNHNRGGALTHRHGGEEQPASPPARSLEFRHRLLPLRPPRWVHPPQPTPLPTLPPRRLSRRSRRCLRHRRFSPGAGAQSRSSRRERVRPPSPPTTPAPGPRRTREAAAGARTQQGVGTAPLLACPRPPSARPPTPSPGSGAGPLAAGAAALRQVRSSLPQLQEPSSSGLASLSGEKGPQALQMCADFWPPL